MGFVEGGIIDVVCEGDVRLNISLCTPLARCVCLPAHCGVPLGLCLYLPVLSNSAHVISLKGGVPPFV